jgi:AcrR family transcriptional regulator
MNQGQTLMERRKQAAVEEIVGTAIDLFTRDGFEDTTVEAIAEAAGCSRRTFYRYFGSKEDVLFYDLPATFQWLKETLDGYLAAGVGLWAAVSEAVLDMIARFPDDDRPVQRMELWLSEPALNARYMQYVAGAERTIVDCLTRHRSTKPSRDDLAYVIAIAAVGAYRTTVATHPAGSNKRLTKHLRELLAMLDSGLGAVGG